MSMTGSEAPGPAPSPPPGPPPPGWYPDPWWHATYRWWDGRAWTSSVSSGSTTGTASPATRSTTARGVVLIVSAVVFALWCVVWLAIFPLLLVNDADNGRLGHDLAVVWLPEFAVGLAGMVVCFVFAFDTKVHARLGNKVLLAPPATVLALVLTSALVRIANG